jgi:GTP-binding protein
VTIRASASLNTLIDFRFQRHYRAEDGRPGGSARKTGARGADKVVLVPVGTVIKTGAGRLVADLDRDGRETVVAPGGRGGRGNARFATPVRQAPRIATRGTPGRELELVLELKLLADAGLVGYPNCGKSTFLGAVSNAHPLVADYPFSTTEPSLGVIRISEGNSFVMADIPGLIEGAHRGRGMGDRFLRHIERTRVLVHLLDAAGPEPLDRYREIRRELADYSPVLAGKPEIIVANKADLPGAEENFRRLREALGAQGTPIHLVSALRRRGLTPLLAEIHATITRSRANEEKKSDE